MEAFIVGIDITDIEQLYGRKRQIEILQSCAKRKSNAGIIGVRRSGKTCILRSMESFLRLHPELNVYPLYFDAKKYGIKKDTSEVYRTMAATLAARMCVDSLLPEGEYKISRRCSLDVSDDFLDMIVQMKEWNSEYQKEVLFTLADTLTKGGKYVLLLLDEIDYLLQEAMDTPSDFSRIRGAATERDGNIKFWVAGVASWSAICTDTGSPELNCGLENITLPLLSEDEFTAMWTDECFMIDDIEARERIMSLSNEMYEKTGGMPYYSKFVGSHILINGLSEIPNYEIVRDYLAEIVNSKYMSDVERSTLYQLAKGNIVFKDTKPDGINGLETKGLIKVNDNSYAIGIGYLTDYLNAKKQDSMISNEETIENQELCSLVDQISSLRKNVNVVYAGEEPFIASVEDPSEFNTLKIACKNEATMDAFSGSIYKLYYEGSGYGKNLPKGFNNRDFLYMVKTLRHMYNHRECEGTTMTKEELLVRINRGMMPFKEEDFLHMQRLMLEAFCKELVEMLEVKKNKKLLANQSSAQNPPTSSYLPSKKVKGIFYEGKFGQKDSVVQDGTQYRQIVRKIRDGESLIDGDEVEYTLCCGPHPYDSTKKYWYAIDVHLKE